MQQRVITSSIVDCSAWQLWTGVFGSGMTDRSVVSPGVPMALAAAVLFGAAAPFAKLLLGEVEP
jgi:hypothetical protein